MKLGLLKVHVFKGEEEIVLSSYIHRTNEGLIISKVVEGKEGPYKRVYDFGHSRKRLRERVPVEERIRENPESGSFIFVGLEKADAEELMREITRINAEQDPNNERARFLYQLQLYNVYKLMQPYLVEHLPKDKTVFFPPKNGAGLIRAFFQERGIIEDMGDVVDYELKRILLKDGRLMVGVIDNYYPEGAYNTAVIIDDCLASDVSVATTRDIIERRYPSVGQTVVIVSAASQRGVEALQGENLTLIAAVPVFVMSDNYYLLRTPEEGYPQETYFVGDMGKWAEPLSEKYNNLAPWNRFR